MANIDFKTLTKVLPYVLQARKPVMLIGDHGIGKSEVVKDLAPKLASILGLNNQDYIYPVVERRASQMADAGDLMGLPQLTKESTRFLPMEWFWQACQQPVLLFLDEVDRANKDVRQAIFELTDSRKIAGHTLHPDTVVIACCNGGAGGKYQVQDMDPAEFSRWTVFFVKPTKDDFFEYSRGKLSPYVYDFLKENDLYLEHDGTFEQMKVYPTRRSWYRLNEALKNNPEICENAEYEKNGPILYHLTDGFVGSEAASAFVKFCQEFAKAVTIEDVLEKGDFRFLKRLELSQHLNLVDKLKDYPAVQDLQKPENEKQLANLIRYFMHDTCVPEVGMKLFETCIKVKPENAIAIHQCVLFDAQPDGNILVQYAGRHLINVLAGDRDILKAEGKHETKVIMTPQQVVEEKKRIEEVKASANKPIEEEKKEEKSTKKKK